MTPRLLPDPPARTPGSMPPVRKRSDPLPTRVIAVAAGVAATLGLIVVLAPPEAQLASGSTDTSAPQGSDAPTDSSALTGDVVESPAPSPVKASKTSKTAKATAKPTHAAKPKAGAGTTTAAAPRVTPKPGAGATPAPKPTPGPKATPRPTPRPTPPPTPRPTPKPTPVPTGASGKP